jgi:DNA-binding NarL/FixJ family response regulator
MEKVNDPTAPGPGRPIRVLLADDHPLLRAGVISVLALHSDMEVVAEACDGREALDLYREHRPDVALIDLQMPVMSGVDAIREIRAIFPAARLIVLTTYAGDVQALRALKAGASGYLLKQSLRLEMPDVIRRVHGGGTHIPPEVASEIGVHALGAALTDRESAVLRLVAEGKSNKSIAQNLGVSEETVKAHLKGVFSKLGVGDRTHAVTIAARRGILDLSPNGITRP